MHSLSFKQALQSFHQFLNHIKAINYVKKCKYWGGGGVTTRIHGHQRVEITHYKALDILKDSHIEKEKSS